MDEIKPGMYRHFKGNIYRVLLVARHSETMEDMVVYKAAESDGKAWVRPASMWNETVEIEGEKVYRFIRISDGDEV